MLLITCHIVLYHVPHSFPVSTCLMFEATFHILRNMRIKTGTLL